MLFYLDYLAVCAQAHDFLQRFVTEWDAGRSILLLPNWAFSLALVTFQHSQSTSGAQSPTVRRGDARVTARDCELTMLDMRDLLVWHVQVLRSAVLRKPGRRPARICRGPLQSFPLP